jgi:serine/threonine protein kinase
MQTLQPNTLLQGGRYKIIKTRGIGFGTLYSAIDLRCNKNVVVLEFHLDKAYYPDDDMGLTNESPVYYASRQKMLKQLLELPTLSHPNLISVTDAFCEEDSFFYVTEDVREQTLEGYIKEHSVKKEEAIDIIKKVADALIYLHEEKHMPHLMVCSENIVRNPSTGQFCLYFYGLPHHLNEDESADHMAGEESRLILGQGNRYVEIDIEMLGTTLYKLLTGERLRPCYELMIETHKPLAVIFIEKGLSQEFAAILNRAIRSYYNIEKPYRSVKEFVADLTAAENGGSISDETLALYKSGIQHYAAKLRTEEKMSWQQIEHTLINEGLHPEDASTVVDNLIQQERDGYHKAANKAFKYGALWVGGGIALTAITEGQYLFYGAIGWGVWLILKSMWYEQK